MKNTLTPDEVKITQMALHGLIEDLEAALDNKSIPWTQEAKQMNTEMIIAAKSAHHKFSSASGADVRLDPYQEGDEKEFLTKES